MRIWLCILLLSIFSLQVLPVKLLGKALAKSWSSSAEQDQDDEGLPDGDGPMKLKKSFDAEKIFLASDDLYIKEVFTEHDVRIAIHSATELLPIFAPDILTPPPNCA